MILLFSIFLFSTDESVGPVHAMLKFIIYCSCFVRKWTEHSNIRIIIHNHSRNISTLLHYPLFFILMILQGLTLGIARST